MSQQNLKNNNDLPTASSFKNSTFAFFNAVTKRTTFDKNGVNFRIVNGNPSLDVTVNKNKVDVRVGFKM